MISDNYKYLAGNLLKNLTESLSENNEFFRNEKKSIIIDMEEEIEFKFEKLIKYGDAAIVANLKPFDYKSEIILEKIKKQREALIIKYKETFGLQTSQLEYSPHISLGYFANKELGKLTDLIIEKWNEEFKNSLENYKITFKSNGIYVFNDMVSYFKI